MTDEVRRGIEMEEFGTQLRLFIQSHRDELQVKERRELSPLEERQSRISGGALLKFLRFLSSKKSQETFPVLRQIQQEGRKLIVVTDDPGFVAAQDVLRMFRPTAVWVLREEWKTWCRRAESRDERFRLHFEYRNWWTQEADLLEETAMLEKGQWIHREGYTLDRNHSRDVAHLWVWTGEEMELLEADISVETN